LLNAFLTECVFRKQTAAAAADNDNTDDRNDDSVTVCLWFNIASVKRAH